MPKTRDNYQVTGATLDAVLRSVNFLFQRMADRIDRMEGIRGEPTIEAPLNMANNPVNDVGAGTDDPDAARLDDVDGIFDQDRSIEGAWTFEELTRFEGPIRVYDATGTVIHSFEGPT